MTPQGYSGTLDAGLDGQAANTRTRTVQAGGRLEWRRDLTTNFALLRYSYGQSGGVQDTDKLFAHARHIRRFLAHLAHEEFVQAERNPFARLSFRGLVGGGLRYTPVEASKQQALHLALGGYYSRERLAQHAGVSDAGIEQRWRLNAYVRFLQRLKGNLRVLSTTYYQLIGPPSPTAATSASWRRQRSASR